MKNLKFLKNIFSQYIDIFIIFLFIKLKNLSINNNRKKILAIIKIDGLGDYVIWKNAIQSIIKYYKDNDFSIIGIFESSSAELASIDEDFDQIIPIDNVRYTSIFYRIKLFKTISQLGIYEIMSITFSNIIGSPHNSISYASNATKIATISQYFSNNRLIGALRKVSNTIVFNNTIEVDTSKSLHEYSRSKKFLQSLEIPFIEINQRDFFDKNHLPSLINLDKNYILIVSDASSAEKCWPTEKYLELSIALTKLDFNIVWAGQENFSEDQEILLEKNNIINLTNKTTIKEFISLVKKSDLLICNDSFPVHVAAFVGVRSICIYWGGIYGRFLPYPEDLGSNIQNPQILPSKVFFEDKFYIYKNKPIKNEIINNVTVSNVLDLITFNQKNI